MAAISHTDISIILSQTRGFEKAFSLSYLRYNAVFLDSVSVLRVYYRQDHTTEVHPMEKPRIGCVVMAAGNASRFGANKLAAQVDGKTLLRRALEAVPPACFAQVVVVTQYPEAAEAARRFSFTPVENQHPDWGISHTISLGLDVLQDCDAALFLVSDQPLLRQASVAELVDLYRRHPSHIVALGHNGVRGNPCLFPARFFPELRALREDHGGSTVIRRHEDALLLYDVPARQLADVDTRAALDALTVQER